jgi:hypothetical protein
MEDWVITTNNLHQLETTFGNGWVSTESARTRKNQLERILTSNGFVYSIATWNNEQQRTVFWVFRQKPVKSLTKLMQNVLRKNNVQDSVESECRWELGKNA